MVKNPPAIKERRSSLSQEDALDNPLKYSCLDNPHVQSCFLAFLACSRHEVKRCLLLGRKVITNLDSILKSRNITLQIKVHLVKAMVFPVVMNECESWTVKKAER